MTSDWNDFLNRILIIQGISPARNQQNLVELESINIQRKQFTGRRNGLWNVDTILASSRTDRNKYLEYKKNPKPSLSLWGLGLIVMLHLWLSTSN